MYVVSGDTSIEIASNNLATQKGARAVEVEVRLKSGVICTAPLLDELTDLVLASVLRTSKSLVRCFCTGYTIKIQFLRTLQPIPGLRSSDEMALEVLRQYKYPASPFRTNATYVDFSPNVALVNVFNCFDDPTVPFEIDCGGPIAPRTHATWLGLEPNAPLTYVIFVGVAVLLFLILIVIILCIYRSRKPAEPPQKVDVLTWRATDPPAGAASPSPLTPLDSSLGGGEQNAKPGQKFKPLRQPLAPSTPAASSPPTTLKKKQLSEQIFITHTPTPTGQPHYKYPTASQLTTFHFHPDNSSSKPTSGETLRKKNDNTPLPDIEFLQVSTPESVKSTPR